MVYNKQHMSWLELICSALNPGSVLIRDVTENSHQVFLPSTDQL